jgi:hypothetical protein
VSLTSAVGSWTLPPDTKMADYQDYKFARSASASKRLLVIRCRGHSEDESSIGACRQWNPGSSGLGQRLGGVHRVPVSRWVAFSEDVDSHVRQTNSAGHPDEGAEASPTGFDGRRGLGGFHAGCRSRAAFAEGVSLRPPRNLSTSTSTSNWTYTMAVTKSFLKNLSRRSSTVNDETIHQARSPPPKPCKGPYSGLRRPPPLSPHPPLFPTGVPRRQSGEGACPQPLAGIFEHLPLLAGSFKRDNSGTPCSRARSQQI